MNMKTISECVSEILELHCVGKNSTVTLKTMSRSLMAWHIKYLYCTCGINIKIISAFLLRILHLHCLTKNSPVPLTIRSFMAGHTKDYTRCTWGINMKTVSAFLSVKQISDLQNQVKVILDMGYKRSFTRYNMKAICEFLPEILELY